MANRDRLEMYCDGHLVAQADTSHAPNVGEVINVRGSNFRVVKRSFSIDYSDDPSCRSVCCNVEVEPRPYRIAAFLDASGGK